MGTAGRGGREEGREGEGERKGGREGEGMEGGGKHMVEHFCYFSHAPYTCCATCVAYKCDIRLCKLEQAIQGREEEVKDEERVRLTECLSTV